MPNCTRTSRLFENTRNSYIDIFNVTITFSSVQILLNYLKVLIWIYQCGIRWQVLVRNQFKEKSIQFCNFFQHSIRTPITTLLGHQGVVISCCWLNEDLAVTAGWDRLVFAWPLKNFNFLMLKLMLTFLPQCEEVY